VGSTRNWQVNPRRCNNDLTDLAPTQIQAVYADAATQQGWTRVAQLAPLDPNKICAALAIADPAHQFLIKNGLAFLHTRPSVSSAEGSPWEGGVFPHSPRGHHRSEQEARHGGSVRRQPLRPPPPTNHQPPDSHASLAPPRLEVAGWHVVRAGYLIKTKWAKGLARSDKRRWVVLRQHPRALAAELEYYEGPKCRGSANLAGARVVIQVVLVGRLFIYFIFY
jgi:hypothetical protein